MKQTLILKMGSQDQLGFLLVPQSPCCMATSLPKLLEAISGILVLFHKHMVLDDFNLPSLSLASEVAQEFMISMMVMVMSDLEQWSYARSDILVGARFLVENLTLSSFS